MGYETIGSADPRRAQSTRGTWRHTWRTVTLCYPSGPRGTIACEHPPGWNKLTGIGFRERLGRFTGSGGAGDGQEQFQIAAAFVIGQA
jgi:hypothetical protein